MAREKLPRGWTRPNRDLHYWCEAFDLVVRRGFGLDKYDAFIDIGDTRYTVSENHTTQEEAMGAALTYGRAYVKKLARKFGLSLAPKRAKARRSSAE